MNILRGLIILGYLPIAILPLAWMVITSTKDHAATLSPQPRWVPHVGPVDPEGIAYEVTFEGYRRLAETHMGVTHSFFHFLGNSALIGVVSTLASVCLGTACAYGFSRFRITGAKDWLFFILSTRFLPPLAVVMPIWLMWGELGLLNTHAGLILLYTAFNLSLAVWLMKGFIDEIPLAYEEAALVDGYSRLAAFFRIILPQARTGMAVTAVFCLISAWNEYAFAVALNPPPQGPQTVPVYFAGLQGNISGVPWPQVAAGALLFVVPIIVFTILVRHHLLRGVTFGTIKQ